MRHYQMSAILYSLMIATAITLSLVIFIFSQTLPVQADVISFIPYGGVTVRYVLPVAKPPCPGHYIIDSTDGSQFGVYLPIGGESALYDYGNLITPGVPVLGGYDLNPDLNCRDSYPVYPIDWAAPFYLTGTGAF